jgi:hypothetical protein
MPRRWRLRRFRRCPFEHGKCPLVDRRGSGHSHPFKCRFSRKPGATLGCRFPISLQILTARSIDRKQRVVPGNGNLAATNPNVFATMRSSGPSTFQRSQRSSGTRASCKLLVSLETPILNKQVARLLHGAVIRRGRSAKSRRSRNGRGVCGRILEAIGPSTAPSKASGSVTA